MDPSTEQEPRGDAVAVEFVQVDRDHHKSTCGRWSLRRTGQRGGDPVLSSLGRRTPATRRQSGWCLVDNTAPVDQRPVALDTPTVELARIRARRQIVGRP
nr:hypothetical protein [Micromonospora sp. DSM 115978]